MTEPKPVWPRSLHRTRRSKARRTQSSRLTVWCTTTGNLHCLLCNFVSLRDFYTPGKKAIFQAGTLYLDGRSCELCVRVADVAAHSALSGLSRTYLAYCECRRRGGDDRMTIVAAFTGGDSDNLMTGRNGVFYDRKGRDWDATIVKIIEHPISVSQAFWAPYKRVARLLTEQIEKFAGAREKAVDAGAAKGIADVSAKTEAGKATPATPFDIAKFAGIFAAIGLALGAIGTALASVVTGFLGLSWWQMPLAFVGLMLVISGPSMLMAYLKLRQRNLGPILDANGWAVNTLARINIPFGATLTGTATLPPGAERSLRDPFAEKQATLAPLPVPGGVAHRAGCALAAGLYHPVVGKDQGTMAGGRTAGGTCNERRREPGTGPLNHTADCGLET